MSGTLRGLTSGVVKPLVVLHCVLVMDGFPSLLLHCKALGLSPLCVLCNPKWTKLVSDLILSGCRVFDQCPCYDWIPSSVTLILVDGRVSSRLLSGFPYQAVVVSTGGSRRPISGWSSESITIRHDLVGGVTASRVFFFFPSFGPLGLLFRRLSLYRL